MSRPVMGANNGDSVWDSATGLLITWQPFDFGLRDANVRAAAATRDRAIANNQRTQLEIPAPETYVGSVVHSGDSVVKRATDEIWGRPAIAIMIESACP